jgi:hypothetical protein
VLSASHPTADHGDDEKHDRNPEKDARAFHCGARDAAEPQERRNECDDEEDHGIVKKIAHFLSSLIPLDDADKTRGSAIRSVAPIPLAIPYARPVRATM